QKVPAHLDSLPELERDKVLGDQARAYIREYRVRFLGRILYKFVRLHERESIGIHWNLEGLQSRLSAPAIFLLKLGSNLYWWFALLLGLGGVALLVRERGFLATLIHPCVFVWACFAGLHAVIVIQDRYHMPINPCIAILGASLTARWRPAPSETRKG